MPVSEIDWGASVRSPSVDLSALDGSTIWRWRLHRESTANPSSARLLAKTANCT